MIRGRKPTPTALKKLRGNPGKRGLPKGEPQLAVDPGLASPPAWLAKDRYASAEWVRLAPELIEKGVLTVGDRAAFEGYCRLYGRWRRLEEKLTNTAALVMKAGGGYRQQSPEATLAMKCLSQLTAMATEFGFTPSSRSRVSGANEVGEDEYQKFLRQRPAGRAAAGGAEAHA